MSYTRNFGFRGFENIVRIGRYRTASELEIGAAVVGVPADGTIAKADNTSEKDLGGVLVYEHLNSAGHDPATFLPDDAHTAPSGAYAQIVHGPGVKVWMKNSATVTLLTGTAPAAGDYLAPGSTAGTWTKAADAASGWLVVESVSGSGATLSVEARFVF